MSTLEQDITELRARFPAADMGAERERLTILDRLQESARINAERLEALEWAMRNGLAITESYKGGFGAVSDLDQNSHWAHKPTLADLADELIRIRERMEAKP